MKQVLNFVKLFLVILLVSFTSCTNDLAPKTTDFNFSFTLPQYDINPRSSTESTSNQISDLQKWIINAQIETSEKVLQNITQEGTSGQTITIHFENIQVSQNVRIDIELTPKGEEKPSYKGTSEWFITKKGSNKIHITLKKIQYEIIPDDDNDTGTDDKPEIIIDAAVPQITTQPENVIEIVTENSGELISMPLSVAAQSTDNGTLSFVWQEKNVDNNIWENSTINSTDDKIKSSIKVDVYKGQYRTFKCIITNTNNSVNGNKTATIETNEVTVAYVQGQLTSIEAQYIGEYEKFNYEDFYTNGKVTVTETYTNGNTQNEVEVTADESRYTISPTKYDEKAFGYVPYTVQYNENQNISTKIRVPVKYELNAEDFIITSSTNTNQSTNSSDTPEKIPQFTGQTVLTVGSKGETSEVPTKIYQDTNSDSSSDYEIMTSGVTSSWKKDSSTYGNTTSITVDNSKQSNSTYNATITPISNSWCVGDPIELEYYVQVCPWTLAVNSNDGNSVEDLQNLSGDTTYTLSAKNEALEATTTTDITWESSEQNTFIISDGKLTTPEATTENQPATITAKVDGTEIGTLQVAVKKQDTLGSQTNPFTNWNELCKYLSESETDLTTIYVQGSLDATETAYIYRPVTIIPVGEVNITLDANLSDTLFNVQADFTIRGNASTNFIIYGDNNEFEYPLISTDNSDITLEYVIMQSYTNSSQDSSNPEGGAISFNCAGKTLSLINCNFTNVITNIRPNAVFETKIGAIYFGNGNLILDNCNFTDEYAHLYCYPDATSNITLKRNITLPIIQYANTNSNGDLQITLDGTFNSDVIKIYVDNIIDGYDTKLFTLNGAELPNYFTLLNEGYEFNYEDGTITAATSGGSGGSSPEPISGVQVSSFPELQSAINNASSDVTIEITQSFTLTETIEFGNKKVIIGTNTQNIVLTDNAIDTYYNEEGPAFYLKAGGFLTIGGGTGDLTIKTVPNKGTAIISTITSNDTTNKPEIEIKDNVTFTECTYYCISLNGGYFTLNINGGSFINNQMAPICINNANATVNINSGTISDNSDTSTKGAGIVVDKGTLNITGGTLQNNKLSGTYSGASIYVSSNGNATVSGVSLTKNAHYTKTIIDGVEQ